jgi:hypothetical protein
VFVNATKPALFEQVRYLPAVLICHFARFQQGRSIT